MALFTGMNERCFGENMPFQSRMGNNSCVGEIIHSAFFTHCCQVPGSIGAQLPDLD